MKGVGFLNEGWMTRYNEVIDLMEMDHRNPSLHRLEEHGMWTWMKANRKKMNAGGAGGVV